MRFLGKRTKKLKAWWQRKPTKADRALAAVIGAIGMFWVAVLLPGTIAIKGPFTLNQIIFWLVGFVFLGIILGIVFPKIISIVLFPFAIFG
ncbi:MAG: hypothetical protein D6B27_01300 [Gammaproteobacteria bacterium]|nr:MAG: hypothetical protein D6B27_01300 [Gammaproteobacteria bacterium]